MSILSGFLKGSIAAGSQNPRPLEYQDDRTLCEAGAAAYCQNREHGAGNLETDGATDLRQGERGLTMFAYSSRD